MDFVYYQANGHHKKAELLARLLRRNRSEERVRAALIALRFIDEGTIDIRKITQVEHIEILSEKTQDNYREELEASYPLAQRILKDFENRKYVESILRNLERELKMGGVYPDSLISLEGASVSDFLYRLEYIRAMIFTYFPMFKVEDIFNHAISELKCDVGDYQTEAPSFYEAWLAEMAMAVTLHSQIISIQNDTQRPLLVVLNERTAPTYFGRDHLPRSYAQRFGIVQDVDDEEILNDLGREFDSHEDLFALGQQIFSRGLIFPLGGFKIASTRNDIEDHTLGVYIRNITRMMLLMGGDVVFVDMSRRRVGGSTSYLYEYLEAKNLASIRPHGKLQERNNNQFDGRRGRFGLMPRDIDKPVTWHLLDPCKIDPEEFKQTVMYLKADPQTAEAQYQKLSRHLSDYLGANKPFADDREHAFYSMHSHDIGSPARGVAARYRKTKPAWFIPDLEMGIVPIHEFLAKITGRVVPHLVNGQIDEAVPYHRFPPYLTARVDAILKGLGIEAKNIRKRFYGSDCFGYLITGIDDPREKMMLRSKLLQAFIEKKLKLRAVNAGISIDIVHGSVDKGAAVRHFSRATGISEGEIVRVGDQPRGNDASLLRGRRSYNVGKDVRSDNIKNTVQKGPDGVLEVMQEAAQEGFDAIALDIDGTIESDPRVLLKINYFLQSGKKVAIVTGRGESIRRKLLMPLEELGLSPKARSNLHIYLFNGALYMKAFQ
ncbi:MAG: hypothetical protein ABH871_02670 [Pseudomonadota bacterium]